MLKLYSTYKIVKEILTCNPETRNSDSLLYFEVAKHIQGIHGTDILNRPFGTVMKNLSAFDLPSFETVRRTRQKLQSENIELRANEEVETYREINEKEYKEFAVATLY